MTTTPGESPGSSSFSSAHAGGSPPPYARPALALGILAVALAITLVLNWPGVRRLPASLPQGFAVALDYAIVLAPLLIGALLAARVGAPGIRRGLALRFRPIDLLLGALAALVLRAFSEIVLPTSGSLWPAFSDSDAGRLAVLIGSLIGLVLLAPLVEELFFRGGVQQALQSLFAGAVSPRVATGVAIGLSTGLFALVHSVPYGASVPLSVVVPPVLVGIGAGLLLAITGRIGAAMTLHVLFNASGVLLLLR